MAFFKRPELEAQGIKGDAQDWLMAELNRRLSVNYVSKDEAKEQADAAVQAALKDAPQAVDPTTTDAYKAVAEERDMLRALGGDDFASVKPKFRESVYKQLDRSEGAPSVADQLNGIREKFEEYFDTQTDTNTTKLADTTPRFGAAVTGSMPNSAPKNAIESVWFGDKK